MPRGRNATLRVARIIKEGPANGSSREFCSDLIYSRAIVTLTPNIGPSLQILIRDATLRVDATALESPA